MEKVFLFIHRALLRKQATIVNMHHMCVDELESIREFVTYAFRLQLFHMVICTYGLDSLLISRLPSSFHVVCVYSTIACDL